MPLYIISLDCLSNYIKGKILYKYFLKENKRLGKKSKEGDYIYVTNISQKLVNIVHKNKLTSRFMKLHACKMPPLTALEVCIYISIYFYKLFFSWSFLWSSRLLRALPIMVQRVWTRRNLPQLPTHQVFAAIFIACWAL